MRKNIVEYFNEVETRQEYKGYFCSIPEAISIVVLGSICGLRNISQIHQWAESDSVIGFLKEKFGIEHIPCYYWLLSLLKLIKPESLNKYLMKWAEAMLPEERKGLTVSLDGKAIQSTYNDFYSLGNIANRGIHTTMFIYKSTDTSSMML